LHSNGSQKHRVARLRHQLNACFGTSGWHRIPKVRSYFGQRLLAAIRIGLYGQHSKHDGYIIDEVRQKSDPHIDRCWSIIVTPCRTEERCFANEAKLTPHSTRFSKKMSAPSVTLQFLKKTLQGAASVILAANTQSSLATLSIRSLALGEILCDR